MGMQGETIPKLSSEGSGLESFVPYWGSFVPPWVAGAVGRAGIRAKTSAPFSASLGGYWLSYQ